MASASVPASSHGAAPRKVRDASIDILRGLAVVVMALDHTRDLISNAYFDPSDLERTSVALFFTRFVTHYCPAIFVFLAGTAAFMSRSRKTSKELSMFLLKRGVWLVVLEIVGVRLGWYFFHFDLRLIVFQVIWAIGWSMIVLSALVFLRPKVVGIIGLVIVVGHHLLDPIHARDLGSWAWAWSFLHEHGKYMLRPDMKVVFAYPLVPWVGVMACGYAAGLVFELDEDRRRRVLLVCGAGLTALFVVLRATGVYGEPEPFAPQATPVFTVMAFLKVSKYPPSLDYLLVTLGPALCALAVARRLPARVQGFFLAFGRAPLFFYLVHWWLIEIVALLLGRPSGRGEAGSDMMISLGDGEVGWGFGLAVVYLVWVGVVLAMYPACRWYAGVKQRSAHPMLSYL